MDRRGTQNSPSRRVTRAAARAAAAAEVADPAAANENPRPPDTERSGLEVLQINLNNCREAHDLFTQTLAERASDFAIVSEPYLKNSTGRWVVAQNGTSAVWVKDASEAKLITVEVDGAVCVEYRGVRFLSTYFSGNAPEEEYRDYIAGIVPLLQKRRKLIVAGDLNAKSTLWGEGGGKNRKERERVETTEEFITVQELVVANRGTASTCVRHNGSSIVDVTLASEDVKIENWAVLGGKYKHTGSDHKLIGFTVASAEQRPAGSRAERIGGWKVTKEALPELQRAIRANLAMRPDAEDWSAEQSVEEYISCVVKTCSDVLPPRKRQSDRKGTYWWNTEIGALREDCGKLRRWAKRNRRRRRVGPMEPDDPELIALRDRRKALRAAIAKSKRQKWEELLKDLNTDPWSKAYKIAMGKLAGRRAIGSADNDAAVRDLFPADEEDWYEATASTVPAGTAPIPFTPEEMDMAVSSVAKKKKKKAPGPDNVTNDIVVACYEADTSRMLDIFNKCLDEGVFPKAWKKGRLVLIPKPGTSKKRPITMLDAFGKLYETLINNRIKTELEENGALSDRQFGFREGKSTAGALKELRRKIRRARSGKRWGVVVSFDIRNAFNSVKWGSILEGCRRAGLSPYLQRLVREYGNGRILLYTGACGEEVEHPCNRGVPQGAVLGPTLWNIAYNVVLNIGCTGDLTTLGFADDTLLIVLGGDPYSVEEIANATVEEIREEIERLGCSFAPEKTVAMLLSPKRDFAHNLLKIYVGGVLIPYSKHMKYLGVLVDDRLKFDEHVSYVAEKTKGTCKKLSGIMRNLSGPKENRRKLYSTVTRQVMLYGCPVWGPGLAKRHLAKLDGVLRVANIRQISGYITVGGDSAAALSGNPPVELAIEELTSVDIEICRLRKTNLTAMARKAAVKQYKANAKAATLEKWNARWAAKSTDSWTRKICGDLNSVNRANLKNTFRTSQLLTAKGVFNKYRADIRKADSDECWFCPGQVDTAEHTLCECGKWNAERENLVAVVPDLTPDGGLLGRLTASRDAWRAFSVFAELVISAKEDKERAVEARMREERRRNEEGVERR